uniref:Endothelin-converting enzyme 2 n=1 Tax=Ceratitis capitata TaxID=7213 RepID=W8BRS5_CERCA
MRTLIPRPGRWSTRRAKQPEPIEYKNDGGQHKKLRLLISVTLHVLIISALTQTARTAASHPFATDRAHFIANPNAQQLWSHVNRTCLGHTCNQTINEEHLEQLTRHIDWSVNACEDFHKHACGKWQTPRGQPNAVNMMLVADDALTTRFVELFESALTKRHALWRSEVAVAAAVNRATQRQKMRRARAHGERAAVKHISKRTQTTPLNVELPVDAYEALTTEGEDYDLVLSKLLQYYRVCKHSQPTLTLRGYYDELHAAGVLRQSQRHWQKMFANLARYGYGEHFIFMRVRQVNASLHEIAILNHYKQKRLNLTAEIYEVLRAHTHKTRDELATEFRALETEVETVVNNMCNNLTTAASASEELQHQTPNDQPVPPSSTEEDCDLMETITFAELSRRCVEVDWQRFIGMPLGRYIQADDLVSVDSTETVCQLARFHNQPKHAHINFLYTLARFLSYLRQLPHNPVGVNGSSGAICLRHMRKTLSVAMTYVYDRVYYSPVRSESDRVINEIFAQLKAEFSRTLTLNRMQFDADILTYLHQKLTSMRINLGNLPPTVNSSFYVDLIWKLNMSNNNFYRNHLHALAHTNGHMNRLVASATKKHTRSPWYTFNYHEPFLPESLDLTPSYYCLSNMIIVPHTYLQTPFYDRQFWSTLLYGDLANTLGHELIHSFDNNFLEYDHAGNMNELMMQRILANVNFARNIQCLNQSTKFLSERVADVSGTRLALNAFLRDPAYLRDNGRLFFLQFAQFFCNNVDEEMHQLLDPTHDSDALRLNYTLSQMPEFLEAFNCPASSSMSAAHRCELW